MRNEYGDLSIGEAKRALTERIAQLLQEHGLGEQFRSSRETVDVSIDGADVVIDGLGAGYCLSVQVSEF